MIKESIKQQANSIIKVIGVGTGGSNAVAQVFNQQTEGIDFYVCNTDSTALHNNSVPNKIQIGEYLTQGLGAGCNPDIGRQACEENLETFRHLLNHGTKLVLIIASLGGGTGSGASPVISGLCKEMGVLSVGIVTIPAEYEGGRRRQYAQEAIARLHSSIGTLIVIEMDKLRQKMPNLRIKDLFPQADNALIMAVKCLTDVINSTGQINVDFADVCMVLKDGKRGIMGYGMAEGKHRAVKAIETSIDQIFLTSDHLKHAKNVLINITSAAGDTEFTMDEVDIIQNYLLDQVGEGVDVILGMGYDATLDKQLKVSIIITGMIPYESSLIEEVNIAPAIQKAELSGDQVAQFATEEEPEAVRQEIGSPADPTVQAAPRDETSILRRSLKLPPGMPKRVTQAVLMPAFVLVMQIFFKFLFEPLEVKLGISLASISLAQLFPFLFYDNLILLKVYRLNSAFEDNQGRLITKHYFSISKDAKQIARLKSWTLILFIVILSMFIITLGLAYKPGLGDYHLLTGTFCILLSILYLIIV